MKIDPLKKGDTKRTMLHAVVANEIIESLNRLESLSVIPSDLGKWSINKDGIVLDLTSLAPKITDFLTANPRQLETVGLVGVLAQVIVRAGFFNTSTEIPSAILSVANGYFTWLKVERSYSAGTGNYSYDSVTIETGATMPSDDGPGDGNSYISLAGPVVVTTVDAISIVTLPGGGGGRAFLDICGNDESITTKGGVF